MANQPPAGCTVFERRDVWLLSDEDPWHPVIEWYARAVDALRARDGTDFADPRSWRHLAEIHGSDLPKLQWPTGVQWNECEHSTWFFLPWHRIYLHHFESIVREAVVGLGGPDDWALPYWNYSDLARPDTRRLPPAFRAELTPDGSANPLFATQRARGMNGNGMLPALLVATTEAFDELEFAEAPTGPNDPAGFGGPVRRSRNHNGGPVGSLENVPHGSVHVGVGGLQPLGWMSRFETAGRDPIFWLHHANVDRVWQEWLRLGERRANPDDGGWLRQRFEFGNAPVTTSLTVADVLDPTSPPLCYRYSDMPLDASPPADDQEAVRAGAGLRGAADRPPPPELVGATDRPVPLTESVTSAEIPITAATGPGRRMRQAEDLEGADDGQRVFLKIENVTGSALTAPLYLVHVNVPEGADPMEYDDRRAGQVAMFGVLESSQTDETHSGSGLTFTFEITALARRLAASSEWEPERLRVAFTPVPDAAGQVYAGDVSVGRVSVYYG